MTKRVVWPLAFIFQVLVFSGAQAKEPVASWERALVRALPQLRHQNRVVIDSADHRYVASKVRAKTKGWPRGDYVVLQSTTKNFRPISPGPVVEFRTENVYRIDDRGGFKELEHKQWFLRPSVQVQEVWSQPELVNQRRARQGKGPVSGTEKREVLSAPIGPRGTRKTVAIRTYGRRWEDTAVHNRDDSVVTYRTGRLGSLFGRRVVKDAGGRTIASKRVLLPRREARRHEAQVLEGGAAR